jgi:hypothetical protein
MIGARVERERARDASSPRGRRSPASGVLALQSRIGNRAVGRLIASRRTLARQDRHVVNGSQVMGFHDDEHAFAHYTYDVVQTEGGLRRDNEHLTIENSLVTLIAVLAKDPEGTEAYMEQRPDMMKPAHVSYAQAYGYSGTDNINFRPANNDQGLRALPAAGAPANVAPKGAASAAVGVESDFTLLDFLNFIDRVFARLGYGDAQNVRTSIETVAGWMGRQPNQLFLNSSQRSDFVPLVLTALHAVAVHDALQADPEADEPARPGGVLGGLTESQPRIELRTVSGRAQEVLSGLPEEVLADIRTAVGGQDRKWERRLGEINFNEVRTQLIGKAWANIKQQAKTQPAVPAPVAVGR